MAKCPSKFMFPFLSLESGLLTICISVQPHSHPLPQFAGKGLRDGGAGRWKEPGSLKGGELPAHQEQPLCSVTEQERNFYHVNH